MLRKSICIGDFSPETIARVIRGANNVMRHYVLPGGYVRFWVTKVEDVLYFGDFDEIPNAHVENLYGADVKDENLCHIGHDIDKIVDYEDSRSFNETCKKLYKKIMEAIECEIR